MVIIIKISRQMIDAWDPCALMIIIIIISCQMTNLDDDGSHGSVGDGNRLLTSHAISACHF